MYEGNDYAEIKSEQYKSNVVITKMCIFGILQVTALLGLLVLAVIYDGTFMYIFGGAALMTLGIVAPSVASAFFGNFFSGSRKE